MFWNYRLLKQTGSDEFSTYTLVEAYYDDDNKLVPHSYAEPHAIEGDLPGDVLQMLARAMHGAVKPAIFENEQGNIVAEPIADTGLTDQQLHELALNAALSITGQRVAVLLLFDGGDGVACQGAANVNGVEARDALIYQVMADDIPKTLLRLYSDKRKPTWTKGGEE